MQWIYILKCEDGYYYVGQTTRLYRRFFEHLRGDGGVNTSINKPENIIAIYPVHRLAKFFEYLTKIENNDYHLGYNLYFKRGGIIENFNNSDDEFEYNAEHVENDITEKMMIDNKPNWRKIRGGKYVRFNTEYDFPQNVIVNELPTCNRGVPCDVKQNKNDKKLYFRCPKKNMWDEMRDEFGIDDEPCNYFKTFCKDDKYKIEYECRKYKIFDLTRSSYWLNELIDGQYQYCLGGCGREYDADNTVRYNGRSINLCFDCLLNKNNELKSKYTVCLF